MVLTPEVYIDASDFRLEDSKDYYGLAPGACFSSLLCGGKFSDRDLMHPLSHSPIHSPTNHHYTAPTNPIHSCTHIPLPLHQQASRPS